MNIPFRLVFTASVWLTVSVAGAGPEGDETHGRGFAWGRLVRPLGIATLTLLLITASAGFSR